MSKTVFVSVIIAILSINFTGIISPNDKQHFRRHLKQTRFGEDKVPLFARDVFLPLFSATMTRIGYQQLKLATEYSRRTQIVSQKYAQTKEVNQDSAASGNRQLVVEPDKVWTKENDEKHITIQINDLPRESSIARGVSLGRERFSQAILSSEGNLIAFAVEGFHGWSGIYDLNSKKITETAFLFEGKITQLSFSSDSRYLATEGIGANGLYGISFWDVQEGKALDWQIPKKPSGLPANVRIDEWTGHDLKILMRWVDDNEWHRSSLKIRDGHILLE